jgi:hypothetical protein
MRSTEREYITYFFDISSIKEQYVVIMGDHSTVLGSSECNECCVATA